MSVKARKKDLKNGRQSIYLDIYKDGKRKYEFLDRDTYFRYTYPKTEAEKQWNKAVDKAVEEIVAERNLSLIKNKVNFIKVEQVDKDFITHFKAKAEARFAVRGRKSNTYCCFNHFCKFIGCTSLPLKSLTEELVTSFRAYLLKHLKQNTARTYFLRFKSVLTIVHKKGLIQVDPSIEVPPIPHVEQMREFLMPDEFVLLINAPYSPKVALVRRMFLFSCLTGLRISDLKAIKWKHVITGSIIFNPVKTPTKLQVTPLSENALQLIGERQGLEDPVFKWPYEGEGNRYDLLKEWIWLAGIRRNITWHTGRHTCATLLLDKTKDLKLVQAMLGHTRITTTEIYAHLLSLRLQEGVNTLDGYFNNPALMKAAS